MKHLFFVGSILLAGLMLSAAPRPAAAQIVIDNVTELEDINSNLSGDYVLGADINAAGANFTPIGETCSASGQGCFTGVLDGNGYTISNLTIQQFNLCCAGLFYLISLGGTVENLQLTNVDIGGYIVGAIASENLGTITQSSVTGTVSGGEFIGGIAGANLGTISQSSMTGTVSGLGLPDAVGGLVGQNSTSHTPSGLFAGKIQQSYSTAAITGGANSTIGGLVGLNGNLSTISQSYSAGSVTGGEMGDVGGLVGANSGGAIDQSYWDTQTSGQGTGVGYNFPPVATGTGLTTAQLQSGLPSGFDPMVWSSRANVNNGFPCLLGVTPGCASTPLTYSLTSQSGFFGTFWSYKLSNTTPVPVIGVPGSDTIGGISIALTNPLAKIFPSSLFSTINGGASAWAPTFPVTGGIDFNDFPPILGAPRPGPSLQPGDHITLGFSTLPSVPVSVPATVFPNSESPTVQSIQAPGNLKPGLAAEAKSLGLGVGFSVVERLLEEAIPASLCVITPASCIVLATAFGFHEVADILKALYSLALIVKDPPNPNYQSVVAPTFLPVPRIPSAGVPDVLANLVNQDLGATAQEEGYLRAAANSLDRVSGALNAGDPASADKQLQAFQNFSNEASGAAALDSALEQKLFDTLRADGLQDITFGKSDVAAFEQGLLDNGFPSDELDLFEQLGLSPATINEFLLELSTVDPTTVPGSLFDIISQDASLNSAIAELAGPAEGTTPVPEPGTILLFVAAIAVMWGYIRFVPERPAAQEILQLASVGSQRPSAVPRTASPRWRHGPNPALALREKIPTRGS